MERGSSGLQEAPAARGSVRQRLDRLSREVAKFGAVGGAGLLVNLLVHTLFWYSQPIFTTDWPVGLYRAELLVVLVEGALYKRVLSLQGFTPWLLSAFLNLCSFFIGLWLWQYLLA